MSDPIEYTGTFKTMQDVVDWINNYTPSPDPRIPEPPTDTDGTYTLKATVANGEVVYEWVLDI